MTTASLVTVVSNEVRNLRRVDQFHFDVDGVRSSPFSSMEEAIQAAKEAGHDLRTVAVEDMPEGLTFTSLCTYMAAVVDESPLKHDLVAARTLRVNPGVGSSGGFYNELKTVESTGAAIRAALAGQRFVVDELDLVVGRA